MQLARKHRFQLQAVGAQLLLGIAGLALITFVCFQLGFGLAKTAFAYVLVVVLISLMGSFSASVVLSILAAACLNYFFAPPVFEFRVDAADDLVWIAVFLTTSLVVTALTTKLRASEARLRTFVDHATDAFLLLDEEWTILDVNRQACDGLGYNREELIGKHKSDFDVALDQTSIQRLRERMVAGEAVTFETRHRRKDGSSFPVEVRVGQFEQGGHRFLCLVRDITERKLIEVSLRQREKELREILETIPAMTITVLPDGLNVFISKRFSDYSGLSEEEGQRSGWKNSVHPEDLDLHMRKWHASLTSGDPIEVESRFRRADGVYRWFLARAAPLRDEFGNILKWYEVLTDIDDHKRAEQGLRESQAKLEAAQRTAHVGWWERDFITDHVSLSDEICRIFGVQPVELPEWHERWLRLIHPEDRPRAAEAAAAALLRGGPRYDVEYRIVRPDGAERIIHSQGDVTWDELGRPLRQFGVLQDITELRRAENELRSSEEALRHSEAYLAEAQRLSHTGTVVFSATAAVYWSQESYRIWELDPVHGLPSSKITLQRIHPDDRERVTKETEEALLQKRDFVLEFRIVLPDGNIKYIVSTGRPFFSADGKFVEMVATHVDVTERERTEEALRESEARFRDYAESASDWLWEIGPDYNFTMLTDNAFGSNPAHRIGTAVWDHALDLQTEPEKWRLVRATLDSRKPFRDFVYYSVGGNGSPMHVKASGKPVFDANGEFRGYRGTGTDVTATMRAQEEHERLRQLESDFAHVNRLSMMGELTASLAHEILHPIATARNNARAAMRFLDMSPPDMTEVREALACIVRDADRGKEIVDRIRDHIKRSPPRNDRFDINQAIEEVTEMVRAPIDKDRVSVRTRLASSLPSVWGDRVQVQQVALNLILNAVEAVSSVADGERELLISTEQGHKGDILVSVQDSGPGIDPEHLDRVFAPFYTTKKTGIGMGLAICQSIISAHGGRLWVEPNRPRGANFQFTLPAGPEDSGAFPTAFQTSEPLEDSIR